MSDRILGWFSLVFFLGITNTETYTSLGTFFGPIYDMCGRETEMSLAETGLGASMTIRLTPEDPGNACFLTVTAPKTHLVNVQFVETTSELHRARIFNHTAKNPPCLMTIFLPQNRRKAVWTGDPCSMDPLPDIDLLTPHFRIVWDAPRDPGYTKGRAMVASAVGKGAICNNPSFHTCSRIGWEPDTCVADALVCDGTQNCPKGSSASDEDDKVCKSHLNAQLSWEQFMVELVKKFKSPSGDWMRNKWFQDKMNESRYATTMVPKKQLLNWREWQEVRTPESIPSTTTSPPPQKADIANSITEVLSHYGPWGYLMLGMLICGTVLMFCGLWECCFRRPKPHDDEPLQTPPTTVLIINQNDAGDVRPPSYEDLDQPPSYSVLFPNLKESDGDISGESGAGIACACANATEMRDLSERNASEGAEMQNTSDLYANTLEVSVISEINDRACIVEQDLSDVHLNASDVSDINANTSDVGVLNVNASEDSGLSDTNDDVSAENQDRSVVSTNTSRIRVLSEINDSVIEEIRGNTSEFNENMSDCVAGSSDMGISCERQGVQMS